MAARSAMAIQARICGAVLGASFVVAVAGAEEKPPVSIAAFEALINTPEGRSMAGAYLLGIKETVWWFCKVDISVSEVKAMSDRNIAISKMLYSPEEYEEFRKNTSFSAAFFVAMHGHFGDCDRQ